jgi:hypothetical protein
MVLLFTSIPAILFIYPPGRVSINQISGRREMKLQVYSVSATQSILNRYDIRSIEVWSNCVFIKFWKGSPKFVSRKAFMVEFMRRRKDKSKWLKVEHYGQDLFQVSSQSRAEPYLVSAQEHFECECEDYANQVKSPDIKIRMCKHSWAVLSHLGFSSFKEYTIQKGWLKVQEVAA